MTNDFLATNSNLLNPNLDQYKKNTYNFCDLFDLFYFCFSNFHSLFFYFLSSMTSKKKLFSLFFYLPPLSFPLLPHYDFVLFFLFFLHFPDPFPFLKFVFSLIFLLSTPFYDFYNLFLMVITIPTFIGANMNLKVQI